MNKIVEIAEKEIGQVEVPKNSNKTKYGKWFGLDGVAWCGIFVSWCYSQAGQQYRVFKSLIKPQLQLIS